MINTNELRLGNWVYDGKKTRFPMQVETIMKDCVYLDFEGNEGDVHECTGKEIVPIPITKELIKNLNNFSLTPEKPPFFIKWIEFDQTFDGRALMLSVYNRKFHIGERIEYVHQLQNVVFALSGKKLEIKKEWL